MILAALAVVAPAPATAVVFSPPLGQHLTLVTEEMRGDGREQRRYRLDRGLTFAAEADGFTATLTLQAATADGDDTRRRLFAAANADLIGRPVVIHLDRNGQLRSVDDVATVWRLWSAGLLAAMQPDPGRTADAARLAAQLDRLPQTDRERLIAAAVTALVATAEDRTTAPARPASVSVGNTTLSGSVQTVAEGSEMVTRLAAQSGADAPTRVTLTSERRADASTGLVTRNRRTERRTTTGGASLSLEITTTLTHR